MSTIRNFGSVPRSRTEETQLRIEFTHVRRLRKFKYYKNHNILISLSSLFAKLLAVKLQTILLFILVMVGLSSCVTVTPPTETKFLSSYHGFDKPSAMKGKLVYEGDLEKMSQYDKVYVANVPVHETTGEHDSIFTRMKIANKSEADMLADSFQETLKEELGSSFTVVNRPERGSLTVRASVVELRPNTPVLFATGYAPVGLVTGEAMKAIKGSYPGAGSVAIQAEVMDSVTKERYYAVIDKDRTGKNELFGGLSRWGRAKSAFRKWSRQVRDKMETSEVASAT